MRKVFLILTMAAPIVLGVATAAQASSVSCPGDPGGRQFQLVTALGAVCRDFGDGNGILNGHSTADFDGVTWTLLDESDDQSAGTDPFKNALTITGTGSSFGEFGIAPAVWNTYSRIVLALQSETGNPKPHWAAFELASGVDTGTWAITVGDLEHANLYGVKGVGTTGDVAAVPEPMSLALLGAGLAIGARRLRRKQ